MASKAPKITLRILLDHIQYLGRSVHQEIESLKVEMRSLEGRLNDRIDRVDRNLTRQIDAIDQRLDAFEAELLPQRVKAIERTIGR